MPMDEFFEWLECVVGGFALVMLACAVLLLDTGCGALPDAQWSGPPDGWCQSHRCDAEALVYTAAGEGIRDILEPALERWSAATGRELTTDVQAGIPVIWQEDLSDGEGIEDCANTPTIGWPNHGEVWAQVIRLDPTPPPGCPTPAVSLLHELEHAMAPIARHVEMDSLFASSTGPDYRHIDEPALERLCETFACAAFQPEQ